jgi:hypothetical protein
MNLFFATANLHIISYSKKCDWDKSGESCEFLKKSTRNKPIELIFYIKKHKHVRFPKLFPIFAPLNFIN